MGRLVGPMDGYRGRSASRRAAALYAYGRAERWILGWAIVVALLRLGPGCKHDEHVTRISSFQYYPDARMLVVPVPEHGVCWRRGLFENATVGVSIDAIQEDGRTTQWRPIREESLHDLRTNVSHPDGEYVYLLGPEIVSLGELDGAREIRRYAVSVDGATVKAKEISLVYRIRCADGFLSGRFALRGRRKDAP